MPLSMMDWSFSSNNPWQNEVRKNREKQIRGSKGKLPKSGERSLGDLPEDMQKRYGKNEGILLNKPAEDRNVDEDLALQDQMAELKDKDTRFEQLMRDLLSGPPAPPKKKVGRP